MTLRAEHDDLMADHQDLKENHERLQDDLIVVQRELKEGGAGGEWRARADDLEQENEDLRHSVQEQTQAIERVRSEASGFLAEMKAMMARVNEEQEREEVLAGRNSKLEAELQEWKAMYSKVKSQSRTASLGLETESPKITSSMRSASGMIKDTDVTSYQIGIDHCLQAARSNSPKQLMVSMRSSVDSVRSIIQSTAPSQEDKIVKHRNRLTKITNNFITASRNHVTSGGIAPVSLVDAAASHLSQCVVELISVARIRQTGGGEVESELEHEPEHVREDRDEDDVAGDYYDEDDGEEPEVVEAHTNHYGQTNGLPAAAYGQTNDQGRYEHERPAPAPAPASRAVPADEVLLPSTAYQLPSTVYQQPAPVARKQVLPPASVPQPTTEESKPAVPAPLSIKGARRPSETVSSGHDPNIEDLKVCHLSPLLVPSAPFENESLTTMQKFLDEETSTLIAAVQSLVTSIRSTAPPADIQARLAKISTTAAGIIDRADAAVSSTPSQQLRSQGSPAVGQLKSGFAKLGGKQEEAARLADGPEADWRKWCQQLPPVAFEVAKMVRGLGGIVREVAESEAEEEEDFA